MGEPAQDTARFNQTDRYAALMDVVRNRMTNRAFAPYRVPREHFGYVSPAWLQAHGHAQVFGWIGSFIFGIGFYSIPKLRGEFRARDSSRLGCHASITFLCS